MKPGNGIVSVYIKRIDKNACKWAAIKYIQEKTRFYI